LIAAARTGASFSPANDAIDLCEAVTGKEFCVSNGNSLSGNQRMMAVLGVIGGSRLVWETLSAEIKAALFHNTRTAIN